MTFLHRSNRITLLASLLMATLHPAAVLAQEAKSLQHAESASLAPIVVTATKQAERLQDVPMSISAMPQAEIERRGALDLLDIAASIPNVSFSSGNGEGRTQSRTISIRGIYGPDTTGLYIDDTPIDQSVPVKLVDVNRAVSIFDRMHQYTHIKPDAIYNRQPV